MPLPPATPGLGVRAMLRVALPTALVLCLSLRAGAQDYQPDLEIETAPVEVDGQVLFRVRGASSMPADARAARVSNRIEAAAADPMKIGDVIGEVTEFRIQVTRLSRS